MSKPARVLGAVVVLALGYSLGSCGDDTVVETRHETKVIKVPTVETHIEYRDKILPLPESCKSALDVLPRIMEGDAEQTAAVGKILLALQDLGTAAAFDDLAKINEMVTVVRKERSTISGTVGDRTNATNTFNDYLKQCEDAIKEAS